MTVTWDEFVKLVEDHRDAAGASGSWGDTPTGDAMDVARDALLAAWDRAVGGKNTAVSWRVQWYSRLDRMEPWKPMGRRDFDTEAEAREFYTSPETVSRIIEDIWRVELQRVTVTTVEDSRYNDEEVAK